MSDLAESINLHFNELSIAYATLGGLNQQVLREFNQQGGERALHLALDKVLERITHFNE